MSFNVIDVAWREHQAAAVLCPCGVFERAVMRHFGRHDQSGQQQAVRQVCRASASACGNGRILTKAMPCAVQGRPQVGTDALKVHKGHEQHSSGRTALRREMQQPMRERWRVGTALQRGGERGEQVLGLAGDVIW